MKPVEGSTDRQAGKEQAAAAVEMAAEMAAEPRTNAAVGRLAAAFRWLGCFATGT